MPRLLSGRLSPVWGLLLIAALLAVLEFISREGIIARQFLPAPSDVAAELWTIVTSGVFAQPLLQTMMTLMTGYTLGCCLAIAIGLLMGYYRPVFLLLEPSIELIRPIPKTALMPLLMLMLGLGEPMKITSVALGAFFPVLINTLQGVRAVDPIMSDMARTFGYSGLSLLHRIFLPASLPYILTGMRISLGIGLVVVITAEMLSGSGGLGDLILTMQRSFEVVKSYAWLVIVAMLGFCLNVLFVWAERRSAFWSAQTTG